MRQVHYIVYIHATNSLGIQNQMGSHWPPMAHHRRLTLSSEQGTNALTFAFLPETGCGSGGRCIASCCRLRSAASACRGVESGTETKQMMKDNPMPRKCIGTDKAGGRSTWVSSYRFGPALHLVPPVSTAELYLFSDRNHRYRTDAGFGSTTRTPRLALHGLRH